MNETIDLMDGALHVYRRENSGKWQCSTCLNGHNYRQSTKTDNLILAQDFAQELVFRFARPEQRGPVGGSEEGQEI